MSEARKQRWYQISLGAAIAIMVLTGILVGMVVSSVRKTAEAEAQKQLQKDRQSDIKNNSKFIYKVENRELWVLPSFYGLKTEDQERLALLACSWVYNKKRGETLKSSEFIDIKDVITGEVIWRFDQLGLKQAH